MTWQAKVNRVIAQLSHAAWRAANHDKHGRRYARHRPYRIPQEASDLVEALGRDDETDAKAIMESLRRAGKRIDD